MNKRKIFNILLIVTSFIGYLEWGEGSNEFLIEIEKEVLSKLFSDPMSVLHPVTLLPLIGQILLLVTLFQANVSKRLTLLGMFGIGILFVLIFAIGCMQPNYKIIISALPFLITSVVVLVNFRGKKTPKN